MINIGIITAMPIEADILKRNMSIDKAENISGIEYYIGNIWNKACVLAICGPGKVNAAICAQTMIIKYEVNTILNSGVAGGINSQNDKKIKIGDVIITNSSIQCDVDTSALGDEVGFISKLNIKDIPCSDRLNKIALKILSETDLESNGYHTGVVMTTDKFINNKETLIKMNKEFKGIACEMECGSIGQVCYANSVEFFSIKVISDLADEHANIDFNKFLENASNRSSKLLLEIIKNY